MRTLHPHITLPELPKLNASTSSSPAPSGMSSDTLTYKAPKSQKHRPDRACDACRRRKARCDGPAAPDRICSSCRQSGKKCTYVEVSRPRGPSKAYVNGLEDKVERLEAFLKTVYPDADLDTEVGPQIIRDSWKSDFQTPTTSAFGSVKSSSPTAGFPIASTSWNRGSSPHSVNVIDLSSAISFHHRKHSGVTEGSFESQSDAEDSDSPSRSLRLIPDVNFPSSHSLESPSGDLHPGLASLFRFDGESSNYDLANHARRVKEDYMFEAKQGSIEHSNDHFMDMRDDYSPPRRAEFWTTPSWEHCWGNVQDSSPQLLPELIAALPPHDLASDLIGLFFANINLQFPLLHRPTFQRNWDAGLQNHDPWFACLCLSVFAVASRWSQDVSVLPDDELPGDNGVWRKAGYKFFEASLAVYQVRYNVVTSACLLELQSHVVMAMFLRGTSEVPLAWTRVGIALRKAQDLGIHRKQWYRNCIPNVEEEQWKRVFWALIALDRLGSATLGRPCCVDETDFDLDLPVEIDDEYWEHPDPSAAFRQPSERPSLVTAFNYFLKLTQVMSFSLRTIYAVDRSKLNFGTLQGPAWQEEVVMQMNTAMAEWVDTVPEHLRWSPRMQDQNFSTQAAVLYTSYYLVQILIYKPFIHRTSLSGKPSRPRSNAASNFPFPAETICVNAAESCARILDSQMQRGLGFIPNCISVAHICGAILTADLWDIKCQERSFVAQFEDVKPQAVVIDARLVDLSIFIKALQAVEPTWEIAHIYLNQLNECLPTATGPPGLHQSTQNFAPPFTTSCAPAPQHFARPAIQHSTTTSAMPAASINQQQFSTSFDASMSTPHHNPHQHPGTLDLNQWFWPSSE